jgi:hypothetical protein
MSQGSEALVFEKLATTPPTPGTEAAKLILESLRPHPGSEKIHTTPQPRIPHTNKLKIATKPIKASFDKDSLTTWQRKFGTHETEHHLYWPKSIFQQAGSLTKEFRDLDFNKPKYPHFQHVTFHRRYDPFILRYPKYLIPHKDIMETAIDESINLKLLGVQIDSLESILNGLDDVSPEIEEKVIERRVAIASLCSRVVCSEIVYPSFVQEAIYRAQRYVPDMFEDSTLVQTGNA